MSRTEAAFSVIVPAETHVSIEPFRVVSNTVVLTHGVDCEGHWLVSKASAVY